MTGWEALANAIVEQAAKDYRAARKRLLEDPYNITARRTVKDVEVFFRSQGFKALTNVSGEKILKMLEEECDT